MKFYIDKQTIADLNIYSDNVNIKSVAGLFEHTQSNFGKTRIYELLATPLSDYQELKDRSEAIRYFFDNSLFDLKLDIDALGFTQYYQKQRRTSMQPTFLTAFWRRVFDKLNGDAQYFLMHEGVHSTIEVLKWIYAFSQQLLDIHKKGESYVPKILLEQSKEVEEIFSRNGYDRLIKQPKIGRYIFVGNLDYQFRIIERRDILYLLDLIFEYDAFSTIARVARDRGFTYPVLYPSDDSKMEVKGLFHPLLHNPVANDVNLRGDSNVMFLSGPNMAGKSTLLKALATAVFLAHAGFPVPAAEMHISVLSGVSATINVADDLSSGYSHFYAEVMRIKRVAQKLKENKNMLVIFDELFRGTNVKDAYDGTEAIIKALSKVKGAFFVVSTHIVEVAEELKEIKNIKFNYLDIERKDGHPIYSYQLKDGISTDRLGLYIIEQEGIVDLINEINN